MSLEEVITQNTKAVEALTLAILAKGEPTAAAPTDAKAAKAAKAAAEKAAADLAAAEAAKNNAVAEITDPEFMALAQKLLDLKKDDDLIALTKKYNVPKLRQTKGEIRVAAFAELKALVAKFDAL